MTASGTIFNSMSSLAVVGSAASATCICFRRYPGRYAVRKTDIRWPLMPLLETRKSKERVAGTTRRTSNANRPSESVSVAIRWSPEETRTRGTGFPSTALRTTPRTCSIDVVCAGA
jgi:hypothetical protein